MVLGLTPPTHSSPPMLVVTKCYIWKFRLSSRNLNLSNAAYMLVDARAASGGRATFTHMPLLDQISSSSS